MSEHDTQAQDTITSEGDQSAEELELELEIDDSEDADAQQEKTYSESEFKSVLARAKKAEAKLKETKAEPKPTQDISAKPADEEIQATVLRAQGMSDELLKELKVIAKVRGTDLLTAQTDPIFGVIKDRLEAERKASEARLGASRGSQTAKPKKDVSSRGLTDEEHKNLWKLHNGG